MKELRARVAAAWARLPEPARIVASHVTFWLAVLVVDALMVSPHLYARGRTRVAWSGEALLLVVLLAGAVRLPRSTAARRVGWLGTWRSWVLGALTAAIFSFEGMREVGRLTMGQQPLLYDAAALGRHLFILGRDLQGARVYGVVAAGILGIVAVGLVATLCWARIERGVRERAPVVWPRLGIVLAVLALGHLVGPMPTPRWSTPPLVTNLSGSFALWQELRSHVRSDAYRAFDDLKLEQRPDIRIYVIESYGALLGTEPHTRKRWKDELRGMRKELRSAGWHVASATSTAPVLGGRSWLADTTLLLGVPILHQSSYQHVIAQLDDLPHLPGFLERHGYSNVLIKPKDRARPGLMLENHFDFAHTVFHDELKYTGRHYGWGVIPDQYTVGFVEDEILPQIPSPRFLFFHLVTSHVPWTEPPPLAKDWRGVTRLRKGGGVRFLDRKPDDQHKLTVRRFRREDEERAIKRQATAEHLDAYSETVYYSMWSVVRQLQAQPDRPTLVLVMGDHQPPLMGKETASGGTARDVPVHVFATDPTLLEELLAHGFSPGMVPDLPDQAPFRHEGLFSLLVRVLARVNGQDAPYYPEGPRGPVR